MNPGESIRGKDGRRYKIKSVELENYLDLTVVTNEKDKDNLDWVNDKFSTLQPSMPEFNVVKLSNTKKGYTIHYNWDSATFQLSLKNISDIFWEQDFIKDVKLNQKGIWFKIKKHKSKSSDLHSFIKENKNKNKSNKYNHVKNTNSFKKKKKKNNNNKEEEEEEEEERGRSISKRSGEREASRSASASDYIKQQAIYRK